MNLWIRTQNGGLSQIEDIEEPRVLDNGIVGLYAYSSKGRYVFLGLYESEKRALEVLDEIQKLIFPEYEKIQKIDGEKGCYRKYFEYLPKAQPQTLVYVMPKE